MKAHMAIVFLVVFFCMLGFTAAAESQAEQANGFPSYLYNKNIEDNGFCLKIVPLEYTPGSNVAVFYEYWGNGDIISLRMATIDPDTGNKTGGASVDVGKFNTRVWDAVWHPQRKVFGLVYIANGVTKLDLVNQQGTALKGVVIINRPVENLVLAWAGGKRFHVYYSYGQPGTLYAQIVGADDSVSLTPTKIASHRRNSFLPTSASTMKGGKVALYSKEYSKSLNGIAGRLFIMTKKAHIESKAKLTGFLKGSGEDAFFTGVYHKKPKRHAIIIDDNFATFDAKGNKAGILKKLPELWFGPNNFNHPGHLFFDRTRNEFAWFFNFLRHQGSELLWFFEKRHGQLFCLVCWKL